MDRVDRHDRVGSGRRAHATRRLRRPATATRAAPIDTSPNPAGVSGPLSSPVRASVPPATAGGVAGSAPVVVVGAGPGAGTCGTTGFDAADEGPVPTLFVAVTVKV